MGKRLGLRGLFRIRALATIIAAAAVVGVAVWAFWGEVTRKSLPQRTHISPVVARRISTPPTGYVGSKACAECHSQIAHDYGTTHSMARSMCSVQDATPIENEALESFSLPDGRMYRVERRHDGKVYHHEALFDQAGEPIYDQAEAIAYALGSGRRGRAYVIDRQGQLFQSPISWYSQAQKFDLAPGYPPANHPRFDRKLQYECLYCHAGRTDIRDLGNDRFGQPPLLEPGIGCERCHGPGEEHVRRQQAGKIAGRDDSIVNPARLDAWKRDSVCYQCHLRAGQLYTRRGREYWDFQPGMGFDEVWIAYVENPAYGEVSGVATQFRSSQCYVRSEGKLGCVTCHDPHSRPAVEDRPAFYRQRCLQCHTEASCAAPPSRRQAPPASGSCIACHMPALDIQDIPHTALTDHRILRDPAKSHPRDNGVDPNAKSAIPFVDDEVKLPRQELLRADGLHQAGEAVAANDPLLAQQALSLLHAAAQGEAGQAALAEDNPEALVRIGMAQVLAGQPQAALAGWRQALALEPNDELTLHTLTLFFLRKEREHEQGVEYARRLVEVNPHLAEYRWLYAAHLDRAERRSEAIAAAEEALALDPTAIQVRAWLAQAYSHAQRPEKSLEQRILLQRMRSFATSPSANGP